MNQRLEALLLAGAIAFVGCSKKDEDKKPEPKAEPKTEPATTKPAEPQEGEPPVGAGDPLLERGAYVAAAGGCALCHTPVDWKVMRPMMDKAFAGGMTMKEVFGTWTSPNITPDPDTGIGKWTDEQITAAVRDGVRPDGSKIHPIMPWPSYRNMTDDDARALTAFLRAQKPIVNKIEPNQLPPMDLPLPPPNRVDPKDDPVGHGAYLASLMHCVACHTPMTEKGPDFSRAFAGGMEMTMPPEMADFVTGELLSSNITSDPETGIGKWSEDDLVKLIKTMTKPDGKPVMGPMALYAPLWSQLSDDDARAVAKFVKTIPPVKNKVVSTFQMKGPPPGGSQTQ